MFSNPYVDGVSVRYKWYLLQPTDANTYFWDDLDSTLTNCANAGKMVCLRIGTGGGDVQDTGFGHDAGNKPHWLVQEIQASGDPDDIFFDFYHGSEADGTPKLAHISVFWSPTKLNRHKELIRAAAARYKRWPALADGSPVVKQFVFGDANASSEDWSIPDSPTIDGIAPAGSSEKSRWLAAGFTAQKIIELTCPASGTTGLIDVAIAAWTNQTVGMPLNPTGWKIDTSNSLYDPNNKQWIPQAIIDNARAKYGKLFAPGKDNINAKQGTTFPSGGNFDLLYYNQPAWVQSAWRVVNDSTYRMNGGTPDNLHNIFRATLNTAVEIPLNYWEVYEADILYNWGGMTDPNTVDTAVYGINTDEIHYAHDQLLSTNAAVPTPTP